LIEAEEIAAPEDAPIMVPCTIYFNDGQRFVVKDIGAWQHTDTGVFATGRFGDGFGTSPEQDVLIPTSSIHHMKLDYDALLEFRHDEAQLSFDDDPELS
jgi:hypothetical protein